MKLSNIGLACVFGSYCVLSSVSSAEALTWDWSYTTTNGASASGTFTTAETQAIGNNAYLYTITGITGTRGGDSIIGFSNPNNFTYSSQRPSQTFTWNGISDFGAVSFGYETASGSTLGVMLNASNGNKYEYPPNQSGYSFSSSSLTPQSVTAVPFDFNPTEGAALGLPLFIGLGMLRKKKLAQKSAAKKVAELVS